MLFEVFFKENLDTKSKHFYSREIKSIWNN